MGRTWKSYFCSVQADTCRYLTTLCSLPSSTGFSLQGAQYTADGRSTCHFWHVSYLACMRYSHCMYLLSLLGFITRKIKDGVRTLNGFYPFSQHLVGTLVHNNSYILCKSSTMRNIYWLAHLSASVCLSVAACPHYCTDPDVTGGTVRGAL